MIILQPRQHISLRPTIAVPILSVLVITWENISTPNV